MNHAVGNSLGNGRRAGMGMWAGDSHDVVALVEAPHVVAPAVVQNVIDQQLLRHKVVPAPYT